MLLKDIPTWFGDRTGVGPGAKYYWANQELAPEDVTIVWNALDVLFQAYDDYYNGTPESELYSRLNVGYSLIVLTIGTSTVPECPSVTNPGFPDDPDLRLLYEAWVITDAADDYTGLFFVPPPPVPEDPPPEDPPPPPPGIAPSAEYIYLMDILTNGNEIDSDRVMYPVDHMPEAILAKMTYLRDNKCDITTLMTGDEIETLAINNLMHLTEIKEYFKDQPVPWTISRILPTSHIL